MPVPEVVSFEIVIVELPEFAILIVCVASVPTVTLPKFTEAGAMLSVEALPEPLQFAVSGALDALLVIESAPDSVAVEVGLKVAVTVALCPAFSEAGTVIPDTVTPVPETDIPEIVAVAVPEFVIFTLCVAEEPIETLPKLIDVGESVRLAETPSPFSGTVVGESSALLVIVTTPVVAPLEVALNETFSVADCPAAIVIGAVIPPTVYPVPVTAIFDTLNEAVPSFVTLTDSVIVAPIAAFPKSSAAGETVIATVPFVPPPPPTAPLPVVPTQPALIRIAAKVTAANAPRTIDDPSEFFRCVVAPPVNSLVVEKSLITEAIVRSGARMALLARGTQLGQVCTTVQWDRPARSAAFLRSGGPFHSVFSRCGAPSRTYRGLYTYHLHLAYGITAVAWFEYELSLLLESTAVTT